MSLSKLRFDFILEAFYFRYVYKLVHFQLILVYPFKQFVPILSHCNEMYRRQNRVTGYLSKQSESDGVVQKWVIFTLAGLNY